MSDAAYMTNDDIVSQADFNDPQVAEYVKAEFQKAIQERIKSLTEIANSLKAGLDKYDIDNMTDLDLVMKDVRRIEDHAEDTKIDLSYFSLVFAKWHKPSEKPCSDDKYDCKYIVRYRDEDGLHLESTWFDPEADEWYLGSGDSNITILGWCEKTEAWGWGES